MFIIDLFNKKKEPNLFGWKPDLPDHRDFKYAPKLNVQLPSSINLLRNCPPVYNQGNLGSCTANAIAAAVQFNQIIKNKAWDFPPSRLFIYYNERVLSGTVKYDSGAYIRTGIKTVNQQGVCKESLWPYNIGRFTVKPSDPAYKEATLHKTLKYERLDNTRINDLKSCLADGLPFVFGFTVYSYFITNEMAKTGILKMPGPNEKVLGGHAVMCVGYDDAKKMFLIRNSWGTDWGLKGYYWMPYDYVTNRNLCDDFWVIQAITVNR